MRHVDRKTLAASIAAHLTYRGSTDRSVPDLSWGQPEVKNFLQSLALLAEDRQHDTIDLIDRQIHAGGTARKYAHWSLTAPSPAVHDAVVRFAMLQRPTPQEKT